jgi:thiol-disulfide isomerase/thioredoxin
MKVSSNGSFKTLISLSLIVMVFCSGCMLMTGAIQNAGVSMMPTYQEIVDNWPEIEKGKGRVVFYFVKQEGSNIIAVFVNLMVDKDKKLKAQFSDRIFVYYDLPTGGHIASVKMGHWSNKWKDFDIKVTEGKIVYAKIDSLSHKDGYKVPWLEVVDEKEAIKDIETFHGVDKPLSVSEAPLSQAQIEPIEEDADFVTINLLDNTHHMGDDNVSRFKSTTPQGEVFESKFYIPDSNPSTFFITISVSDMVPKYHKQYLKGNYRTKLVINGSKIAILNNYISGTKDKPIIEDITIEVDKHIVKKGYNEIKIIAGYRRDKNNCDDFQIHKIIVKYKR